MNNHSPNDEKWRVTHCSLVGDPPKPFTKWNDYFSDMFKAKLLYGVQIKAYKWGENASVDNHDISLRLRKELLDIWEESHGTRNMDDLDSYQEKFFLKWAELVEHEGIDDNWSTGRNWTLRESIPWLSTGHPAPQPEEGSIYFWKHCVFLKQREKIKRHHGGVRKMRGRNN